MLWYNIFVFFNNHLQQVFYDFWRIVVDLRYQNLKESVNVFSLRFVSS